MLCSVTKDDNSRSDFYVLFGVVEILSERSERAVRLHLHGVYLEEGVEDLLVQLRVKVVEQVIAHEGEVVPDQEQRNCVFLAAL